MLTSQVLPAAEQREYTVALPIYDIRDYNTDAAPGIYTFGGFIGELMITLQALQEYMMTKAENPAPFEIKAEGILKFLEEMIDGYPAGLAFLRLTGDPLPEEDKDEDVSVRAESAARRLMQGTNIQSYGMKFLMEAADKVGLNADIIFEVLQAVCQIHYYQKQEPVAVPEEASEEERDRLEARNEENEKSNELFEKLKQYVQLEIP